MRIFKVFAASGSGIAQCDGIEYEGRLWLVPEWLESPSKGYKQPARLVRFDTLQHQKISLLGCEYAVNVPIPKDVLDGKTTSGYEVLDAPDIRIPIPKGVH